MGVDFFIAMEGHQRSGTEHHEFMDLRFLEEEKQDLCL